MEKRLLIAAVLSLLVLVLWEWIIPKPARRAAASPTPVPARPAAGPAPTPSAGLAESPPSRALPPPASAGEEKLLTLENGLVRATFTNRGAVLTSFLLMRHRDEKGRPLDLVATAPAATLRPLALDLTGDPQRTTRANSALYLGEKESERSLSFRYADQDLAITKRIRLGSGYLFEISVSVAGASAYRVLVGPGLRNPTEAERSSTYVMPTTAVIAAEGGLERLAAEKAGQILTKAKREGREAPLTFGIARGGFAGLEDNYFLTVLLPREEASARVDPVSAKDPSGKPRNDVAVAVSGRETLSARAYFGPKDVEVLDELGLGLERTVDFGWFGIVARPLLWLLKKTYVWVGNYGVAILVVTFLIRLLLFPLMHKSYMSMKKMQKLAPKMTAIRDKYKKARTDPAQRQKMNQEVMALYQAEGYNPMSGCFPILLQLPVLVAFYNVLSRSIELRHAPFVLWIRDLSGVDHTYVLVILMIVSMYAQQAMTPSTLDPTQKKIFMAMPLVWGFFLKNMPSGLVLYWLFSNLLTILQQLLINRMVNGGDQEKPGGPRRARARPARA
jgi:YidC/Oxa1 family membrane protein insertase